MKKVCVVVCNNGLGHLKRVLHILRLLLENKTDAQFNIFVDRDKLQCFPVLVEELREFRHQVSFLDIKSDVYMYEEDILPFYKELLYEADWMWSDNLVFPLDLTPKCVLTGSFLWCDIYDRPEEEALLKKRKPLMIGSRLFATEKAKVLTNFHGVDLYEYSVVSVPAFVPQALLISCGCSEVGRELLSRALKDIQQILAEHKQLRFFMEPLFFENFKSFPNVCVADFTEDMFSSIGAAVIRPGMGTINSVLSKGGRIFAFYEDNNGEVAHNAAILDRLNVGADIKNFKAALEAAVVYLSDSDAQAGHGESVKQLTFGGLRQTADKLHEVITSHESEIKTAHHR